MLQQKWPAGKWTGHSGQSHRNFAGGCRELKQPYQTISVSSNLNHTPRAKTAQNASRHVIVLFQTSCDQKLSWLEEHPHFRSYSQWEGVLSVASFPSASDNLQPSIFAYWSRRPENEARNSLCFNKFESFCNNWYRLSLIPRPSHHQVARLVQTIVWPLSPVSLDRMVSYLNFKIIDRIDHV